MSFALSLRVYHLRPHSPSKQSSWSARPQVLYRGVPEGRQRGGSDEPSIGARAGVESSVYSVSLSQLQLQRRISTLPSLRRVTADTHMLLRVFAYRRARRDTFIGGCSIEATATQSGISSPLYSTQTHADMDSYRPEHRFAGPSGREVTLDVTVNFKSTRPDNGPLPCTCQSQRCHQTEMGICQGCSGECRTCLEKCEKQR